MLKKIYSFLWILVLILSAGILSSCMFSPTTFRSVQYHDLGTPEILNEQGPYVNFSHFQLNGPYKNKMVFREKNNQLVIEEYNKWAQTPESMLERYLALAFRAKPESGSDKNYVVSAEIMVFEAEISTKQAVLIVEYSIVEPFQGRKKSFSRTFSQPMPEITTEAFAAAMAEIVVKFAAQLKSDMEGMK